MVPEKWQRRLLGDVARIIDCKHRTPEYTGDGIPIISPGDITPGALGFSGCRKVSREDYEQLMDHCSVEVGDIVIGRNQSVGIPAFVDSSEPFVLGQDTVLLQPVKSDKKYTYHYFLSSNIQSQIRRLSGGSTFSRINLKDIRKLTIDLPSLREQTKIARILSTWDKAIETTEKLIANSQTQKKALMQQLLSKSDWPLVALGNVGEITSAGVDKKSSPDEKPVRLLNYLDVYNKNYISGRELTHWVTAPDRQIKNCDVRKGDVFFTPSSETRDDIAHSAIAVEDISDAVYSYHVVRFRLNESWDLNYRAYAFKTAHFYKQACRLCEGSGQRYVLSQRYFRHMTVRVPPIEEQKVIGAILRKADEEIENFKAMAVVLREEKKALMQQLLTGKRRVKLDSAA